MSRWNPTRAPLYAQRRAREGWPGSRRTTDATPQGAVRKVPAPVSRGTVPRSQGRGAVRARARAEEQKRHRPRLWDEGDPSPRRREGRGCNGRSAPGASASSPATRTLTPGASRTRPSTTRATAPKRGEEDVVSRPSREGREVNRTGLTTGSRATHFSITFPPNPAAPRGWLARRYRARTDRGACRMRGRNADADARGQDAARCRAWPGRRCHRRRSHGTRTSSEDGAITFRPVRRATGCRQR